MLNFKKAVNSKALTLIEILIAIFIIVIGLTAVIHQITLCTRFITISKETTIALTHAKKIIESILNRAEAGTGTYELTDYFPDGIVDGPTLNPSNPYDVLIGGYTLTDEHITIIHHDNPPEFLNLTATVSWDRFGPAGQTETSLRTIIKK